MTWCSPPSPSRLVRPSCCSAGWRSPPGAGARPNLDSTAQTYRAALTHRAVRWHVAVVDLQHQHAQRGPVIRAGAIFGRLRAGGFGGDGRPGAIAALVVGDFVLKPLVPFRP